MNKTVYVYHKTNLYLICHIRCKIYLLIYSWLGCIHCWHGEKPYCFLHILLSSKMRSGARINHQGTFCQKKDAWTNKRIKQKSALKKGKTEERWLIQEILLILAKLNIFREQHMQMQWWNHGTSFQLKA